jgi:hypothetical protein
MIFQRPMLRAMNAESLREVSASFQRGTLGPAIESSREQHHSHDRQTFDG